MAKASQVTKKKTTKKSARKRSGDGGGKNLLIVESPAKAKTINKFLGRGFTVRASMGHVRDIPSKGRGKAAFGIDFENNYKPTYVPIKTREKTLNELAALAREAKIVYLAPDPDREGEAIAWHLKEALDLPDEKVRRVTFNAITKNAVQEAIKVPTAINMNLVNAQQGRRILDRLVGFSLSPFLWKKITKGLSAGRVQSVAVKIVVDREREIQAFNPEEFWRIAVDVSTLDDKKGTAKFQAQLVQWSGKKFVLGEPIASTGESATAIAAELEKADYAVNDIKERKNTVRPSPPFITSSLQQAASTQLGFGTSKTMRVAQQLYEGIEIDGAATGLITYMRTDSTRIAPEAIQQVRDHIGGHFSPAYLPAKPNVFSAKKNAQDAHEAIRPASAHITPDAVRGQLSSEQYRLYDLIWRRFVASQMTPAEYLTTTVVIHAAEGVLEAKGRVVIFDGHTILGAAAAKKKRDATRKEKEKEADAALEADANSNEPESAKNPTEQILPALNTGDGLLQHGVFPTQHFTQPPPRYSEASLVRALEKEGIGRPSTYAPIVKTIQDRGYVRLESRRFFATELGMAVTDMLVQNFTTIMELQFTANLEGDLDQVEEGKRDWVDVIDGFYKPFEARLEKALKEATPLKGQPAPNDEKCPQCKEDMQVRYSQRGAFLGCTAYPECKGLMPMPGEDGGEDQDPDNLVSCPKCGSPMLKKRSKFGDFLACSSYPACNQTLPLGKDGQPLPMPEIILDCNKCGKPMVVKMGRRGPFLACSGYDAKDKESCRNTKHIDREGKVVELPEIRGMFCEKCGTEMIVRMSRRGPFMACPAFPKCRNAKPLPKKEGEEDAAGKPKKKAKKKAKKKTKKKAAKKKATKKVASEPEA